MKWEYHFEVLALDPLEESEQRLNALGNERWEVVAMMPKMGASDFWTIALLKRPIPASRSS
jgi:hypothetical protein